jgi:hypothetical protein
MSAVNVTGISDDGIECNRLRSIRRVHPRRIINSMGLVIDGHWPVGIDAVPRQ